MEVAAQDAQGMKVQLSHLTAQLEQAEATKNLAEALAEGSITQAAEVQARLASSQAEVEHLKAHLAEQEASLRSEVAEVDVLRAQLTQQDSQASCSDTPGGTAPGDTPGDFETLMKHS